MRLSTIIVSVNYSDLLERSISLWHGGSDRLIIITSSEDTKTQELCRRHNVEMHITDVFTANGAHFNKGAAMSEAVFCKGLRDRQGWILTVDADIVPNEHWRDDLEAQNLQPGTLYGARRHRQPEKADRLALEHKNLMPQKWVIGFFTLFHTTDHHLPPIEEPLFDICWPHAGNYDTAFTRRWQPEKRRLLKLPLIHLGDERSHWLGRGKRQELHRKFFSGRPSIEDWSHERMKVLPTLRRETVLDSLDG